MSRSNAAIAKSPPLKRKPAEVEPDEDNDSDEPVSRRPKRQKSSAKQPKSEPTSSSKPGQHQGSDKRGPKAKSPSKPNGTILNGDGTKVKPTKTGRTQKNATKKVVEPRASSTLHDDAGEIDKEDQASDVAEEDLESEEEKPEVAAKARAKVQSTLKGTSKDPYPDWKAGDPVPYAALCTTFSLVEMTTKRLEISAHCSLFLRQVLRLTPDDLLPTIQLMINKLAADYAGIELGIGESLIMKAIGESTGRNLAIIKADQAEIGDLGLVAAKSRSNQPTMFKPKSLTIRGVLDGLMGIATVSGDGAQSRKVAGIKKLLSAADASLAGKGSKGIDITKDKGGASEAKFIIRFLEGKLRLGLAEKTVLVALAHAMVIHEAGQKGAKMPNSEELAKGESILKTVFRYVYPSKR